MSPSARPLSRTASSNGGRLNRLVELAQRGEPAWGLFASNLTARSGGALAASGLDFVIADLEHSPLDFSRLEAFLLGLTNRRSPGGDGAPRDVVSLVRLPASGGEPLLWLAKQALDLGPMGVVVPQVENSAQARAAVRACRFAQRRGAADRLPAGLRGVGYGWAARQWGLTGPDYARRADLWPLDPDGELLLWCMIETREGVRNCRQVARTPGVGGIFVGPSDLAFSLGVDFGAQAVERAIRRIALECRQAQIPCGIFASYGDVEMRLDQGFQFIAVGGDTGIPHEAALTLARGKAFRSRFRFRDRRAP